MVKPKAPTNKSGVGTLRTLSFYMFGVGNVTTGAAQTGSCKVHFKKRTGSTTTIQY